jgi:hypothetical protein
MLTRESFERNSRIGAPMTAVRCSDWVAELEAEHGKAMKAEGGARKGSDRDAEGYWRGYRKALEFALKTHRGRSATKHATDKE